MNEIIDLSYRILAARYVRKQAKQLAEQLDGARSADDIEYIHHARVASRRLRAALKMFRGCFEKRRMRKWRKQVRGITRGLGEARDKDVQIEFLCDLLGRLTDKACVPGVARLLARLEQEREQLQPDVLKAVRQLEAGKAVEEMLSAAKEVLAEAKSEVEIYGLPACRPTAPHILRRLEELLQYEDGLERPEDQERHHAMRIASKRLRYSMEIAKAAYAGDLEPMIEVAKRLQTYLGDIHDCDVWLVRVDTFAEDERDRLRSHFGGNGRFARLEPGIEYLRSECRQRRCVAFRELAAFWQDVKQQGLWNQLLRVVESRTRPLETDAAGEGPLLPASPPSKLMPVARPPRPAAAPR